MLLSLFGLETLGTSTRRLLSPSELVLVEGDGAGAVLVVVLWLVVTFELTAGAELVVVFVLGVELLSTGISPV